MFGSRVRYLILSVMLVLLFSSCSLFNSSEDSVDARLVIGQLSIENNIDEPIYYFAIGELAAH